MKKNRKRSGPAPPKRSAARPTPRQTAATDGCGTGTAGTGLSNDAEPDNSPGSIADAFLVGPGVIAAGFWNAGLKMAEITSRSAVDLGLNMLMPWIEWGRAVQARAAA